MNQKGVSVLWGLSVIRLWVPCPWNVDLLHSLLSQFIILLTAVLLVYKSWCWLFCPDFILVAVVPFSLVLHCFSVSSDLLPHTQRSVALSQLLDLPTATRLYTAGTAGEGWDYLRRFSILPVHSSGVQRWLVYARTPATPPPPIPLA
jgi:hypothetical protein